LHLARDYLREKRTKKYVTNIWNSTVTGKSAGLLVTWTQIMKGTKLLAHDTGSDKLGGFRH
jgi:hypothetical protein